jgi:tricorn protease
MRKFYSIFVLFMILPFVNYAQEEARLLRFPAVHGDQVVFTYAGDLYTVNINGGLSRKLTSGEGYEMFARFSPDGKHIAFTGQYDGNTEVFVIPSEGGIPRRLTYTATLHRDDISDRMGPNNIVLTWKDNENIIFRSRKNSFNSFKGQLYSIHLKGGMEKELPLPEGGFCSFSKDNSKMAYNRVMREFRTWKYYSGGMADDVWIYDFQSKETKNITNNKSQDIFPMWYGDKIYFLSDRERTMNMFSYNIQTGDTKKVTDFTEYDIKFPSLGDKHIIFENGGYLYLFDLSTEKATKLNITIANDMTGGRLVLKDASQNIASWDVSPNGKRMVFGARGDVFTVPAQHGFTRNLTHSSGIHDRDVNWSPDGKYIAYISDRTGETEIFIQKQDGSEEPIQLTFNADTYKYGLSWSPDSKKILWSDKMQRLQYVDIDSKEVVVVDKTPEREYYDFTWSPDSRWIAFSQPVNRGMSQIFIYNLESQKSKIVTDMWYASRSPRFSPDGKYLFFTSSRDFHPIYSHTEWNHAYVDMSKIYFILLQKDTPNPFVFQNDEVDEKNEASDKEEIKNESKEVSIDFENITERIVGLPVSAGSYRRINIVDDNVYYVTSNRKNRRAKVKMYNLKKQKETKIAETNSYLISADQKKMAITKDGKYYILDLPKRKANLENPLKLDNMKMMVDLHQEWHQIFTESWRQMRDFFYDPNMHGIDWQSIYEKYEPLVKYVNNRNDLNYIIGEMIGELSTGHAYVNGGDKQEPLRIRMGLLGAKISRDQSGYYKIDEILKGENWTKSTYSPLAEPGVKAHSGDYIIAINEQSTKDVDNIYKLLIDLADSETELTLNHKPRKEGAWKVMVKPVEDESALYYFNWVRNNVRKVNEATNGQVGYIHIPDMSAEGLNEFVKYYYPQLNKRALIIDDRGNGGGNVSPMIIERLRRELGLMTIMRNGQPHTKPVGMMYGPKVLLIDKYSASDGDLFPYQFKKYKIGKVIGRRTWGGVVGIRGSLPFIDGASLHRPEFAHYDADLKKFVIEGYGVDPDIDIDNDPAKEYAGEDEQLNKAIEVILEELKNWPEELPPVPPYPIKNK